GPTEGLNLVIKKVKRAGHGFRRFDYYRLRCLLHAAVSPGPTDPRHHPSGPANPHSDEKSRHTSPQPDDGSVGLGTTPGPQVLREHRLGPSHRPAARPDPRPDVTMRPEAIGGLQRVCLR
ncbi:MAG: transposase, partial [Acidimicrobiia bacterium]